MTSMPFWNLMPWTTFGNWFSPFNRRHVLAAAVTSLNTMSLPVLGQAGDRLLISGSIFVGEHVDCRLGRRSGRRAVNLTKVCLHVDLDREGDLVQHVGGLVHPTPLVPGAGKDLLDRLPEAERAVADGEVRRDLEPTSLDVDEELTPTMRALAHAGLEADEFLLALRCRADQHEHAFGIRFHPGLQVDPVRPYVHVSPRREVALLPGVVIRLPLRRQPCVTAMGHGALSRPGPGLSRAAAPISAGSTR